MTGSSGGEPAAPLAGRTRTGRIARLPWGRLLALAAAVFVFYSINPHKSLIRRRLLPGYWLLALEGKTLYDPELRILRHGDPAVREAALTIDDGPHPEYSGRLMDALKAAGAHATFYVVGSQVKAHPELVRRMIAEGNEVGNHTNEHLRLTTLTDREAHSTLTNCEINVRLATHGYRMTTFRPPGGEIDSRTARIVKGLGYTTILWSDTSGDYDVETPDQIVDRIMDGAEPGAIILLHDAHESTVQALPVLLARLKAEGLRVVSAREMLHSMCLDPHEPCMNGRGSGD